MSETDELLKHATANARDRRVLEAVGPGYFGSEQHKRDLEDARAIYSDQDLPSYFRRMGYCVGAATARKREREQAVLDARERRDT